MVYKILLIVLIVIVCFFGKYKTYTEKHILVKKEQNSLVFQRHDMSRFRIDSSLLSEDEVGELIPGREAIVIFKKNWFIGMPQAEQVIITK